jgi:hypothetical protein
MTKKELNGHEKKVFKRLSHDFNNDSYISVFIKFDHVVFIPKCFENCVLYLITFFCKKNTT